MKRTLLASLALVLATGTAVAQSWTGVPMGFWRYEPNPDTYGGTPTLSRQQMQAYLIVPAANQDDCGWTPPPICYDGIQTQLFSMPANSLAAVEIVGSSYDPNSNQVTSFYGGIPLSSFATASSVNALQESFNMLSQQIGAWEAEVRKSLYAQARIDNSGVAQALAMAGTTDLQPDENYAVSFNVGTFRGQTAVAGGGVARLSRHVSFNAGVTAGLSGGPVGARAGIRFGW